MVVPVGVAWCRLALPGCGSPGSWGRCGRVVRPVTGWPRRGRRPRGGHLSRGQVAAVVVGVGVGHCG